ncbi:hypothetical protein GCK32_006790 [Trichostrongylus colubriformis]|uniref:Uncharacterized protein n=1 Tax=Trichostrongylus colubriformis TaxID=6319 RepID=A0AAN8IM81_TRICO
MSTTPQQEITEEFCIEHGVQIATSTYYRISLLSALLISTASVNFMVYLCLAHTKNSLFFHHNLRMMFFSLCLCCFAFDIINIAMKVKIIQCNGHVYKRQRHSG